MERPDAVGLTGASHTIRLRGFWETAEKGAFATHSRNFGRPRTVDESERVWLACSTLPAPAQVRLNGELIDTLAVPGPYAVDITLRLRPRNTISFTLPSGKSLEEVAIEIRRSPG